MLHLSIYAYSQYLSKTLNNCDHVDVIIKVIAKDINRTSRLGTLNKLTV